MNKIVFVTVLVFSFLNFSFAQNRKAEWATIKTPNLRCWECKKRVEDYMAREVGIGQAEAGIMKLQINLLSGTTRVQYWTDRVNLGYIKTAFANAGFDADEVTANEDSYQKLPPACKRVEDGGGPQKGKPCHVQPF